MPLPLLGTGRSLLGASFSPARLGGLILWVPPDRGNVYSDAGGVPAVDSDPARQWNDLSGQGRNASQATLAKRPIFKTAIVNGKPVLRFVAASSQDLRTAIINHGVGTGDFLWMVVVRSTDVTPGFAGILGSGAFSPALYFSNSKLNLYWGGSNTFNSTLANNTWYVVTIRRSAGVISCRINGVQEATTFAIATNMNGNPFAIGSDGDTSFISGDIPEVLFCAADPGLASISQAERHLGATYAIAVA